jgi:hypothetical protein
MMLERIGIIGKTQGVSDRSSPKPKKLPTSSQKPLLPKSCAIRPDSSVVVAGAGLEGAAHRLCRVRELQRQLLLLRRIADAGVGATLRCDFQRQRQGSRTVALDGQTNADEW